MKRIVAILMTVVMLIGAMTAFAMTSHADAPDATVPKNNLVPFTYNSTGWWWKQGDTDTEAETAWKTGESVTVENGWAEQTTGVVDNNWATDAAGSVNKYFWAVREFEVPESFDLANSRLWFDLDYDDNIKIYVNGTLALEDGGWSNRKSQEIGAASDYLKVGTNVIAVSLVQGDGGYSFDLGLTATTQLDQTLSVPAGKDYTFYAQTRTNRQNAANKDVRIICVAKQSWLEKIPNFVVTFTFTDGTTPKSLSSFGLKTVFKSITAYGQNGNIDTFVAAEGAVIFGWIITEVPEAYADVSAHAPTASVNTAANAQPGIKPGADYVNPVETKIVSSKEIVTAGVYTNCDLSSKDKVGSMNAGNGSKASYILSGNYEGLYYLKVGYIDKEGSRWIGVTVNGESMIYKNNVVTGGKNWDDVSDPGYFTIPVQMKNGANVITFSAVNGWAPNLVNFSLTRAGASEQAIERVPAPKYDSDGVTVINENGYEVLSNGNHGIEKCDDKKTPKIGWLNSNQYVTYSVDVPTAGKWAVKLSYLKDDNSRNFALSVGEGAAQKVETLSTGSYNDQNKVKEVLVYLDLTQGTYTFKISGANGDAPNLLGVELARIPE